MNQGVGFKALLVAGWVVYRRMVSHTPSHHSHKGHQTLVGVLWERCGNQKRPTHKLHTCSSLLVLEGWGPDVSEVGSMFGLL